MPPKPATPAAARPAPSMGGKTLLVGIVGLAIGLVAGYGAGRVSTGTPINPLNPPAAQPSGVQPGTPIVQDPNGPPALESSSSLTGTAVAATASSLTFDADLTPFDPSRQKGLPVRRTANLTSETVIVRLVEKSPQEIAADQEAFIEANAEPRDGPPPLPPAPYKEVAIAATDIEAGEMVTVTAAEDIVKAESFTAVRVTVAPETQAVPQPPPPPVEPASQPPDAPPTP